MNSPDKYYSVFFCFVLYFSMLHHTFIDKFNLKVTLPKSAHQFAESRVNNFCISLLQSILNKRSLKSFNVILDLF